MARVIIRIEDGKDGEVKITPIWHPEVIDPNNITGAQVTAGEILKRIYEDEELVQEDKEDEQGKQTASYTDRH